MQNRSSATSAYFERSGRPQLEGGPGPLLPQLTNSPQQLSGFQQQPVPNYAAQSQSPVAQENASLKKQMAAMMQYVQQLKDSGAAASPSSPKKDKKCDLLLILLMGMFAAVVVALIVLYKKLQP